MGLCGASQGVVGSAVSGLHFDGACGGKAKTCDWCEDAAWGTTVYNEIQGQAQKGRGFLSPVGRGVPPCFANVTLPPYGS